MTDVKRAAPRTRLGKVVSDKMEQTVVVQVQTTRTHPLYSKAVRRARKLYAHDESNSAKVGDVVRITETRPISKLKRWRVVEVVERAVE